MSSNAAAVLSKLKVPSQRDIADLKMATKTFKGGFGSVDALGNYRPTIDGKQLWIMAPIEDSDLMVLIQNAVPDGFKDAYVGLDNSNRKLTHYLRRNTLPTATAWSCLCASALAA